MAASNRKWDLETISPMGSSQTTGLDQSSLKGQVLSLGEDLGEANFAVIFDMDGTLIDNTPYHFKVVANAV